MTVWNFRAWKTVFLLGSFICFAQQGMLCSASTAAALLQEDQSQALAEQLLKAQTDQERTALLEGHKDDVTPKLVQALVQCGKASRLHGAFPEALAAFGIAQQLAEQLQDKSDIFDALFNIGIVRNMQDNFPEALKQYQQALAVATDSKDPGKRADALSNIGIVYAQQGDFDQAREFYKQALAGFEETQNKIGLARTYNNIGLAYQSQGNYRAALENFSKSLQIKKELADKQGIPLTMANIGHIYEEQNDYAQALQWYQQAKAMFQELNDKPRMAILLIDIGEVYRMQDKYTEALDCYKQALSIDEELGARNGIATASSSIGMLYSDRGDYRKAIEYFEKSLSIRERLGAKVGIAHTVHSIAKAHYSLGDYSEAVSLEERATALAKQINNPEILWYSRTSAGMAYRALGQYDQARAALTEAIGEIEKLREQVAGGEQETQLFFTDRLAPYQEMVELLIAQNQVSQALSYVEQIKGRVLLDVLQSGKVRVNKNLTPGEQDREQALGNDLISLNKQVKQASASQLGSAKLEALKSRLQEAQLAYQDFQTTLYVNHPELKVKRGQAQPLTFEEAAQLLPDGRAAVLEFLVAEQTTHLFVLTREAKSASPELRVYSIKIKAEELGKKVEHFRQQLAARDLTFHAAAAELYKLLLKPAERQLQDKTELLLVPDQVLWELPFQVLSSGRNRYLLEDCSIAYVPSLTVLREMMRPREKNREGTSAPGKSVLFAMGDPATGPEILNRTASLYRGEKPGPLPEAGKEVKALQKLFGNAQSEVYVGRDAREDRFKAEAGKFRILHLATHGIFNDVNPMYSHVLLSPGEGSKEDGLLEAWEIAQLDLNADLAVLSACETARGRIGAGEGVIGLSWAFFIAGVPATVVSQWKVESSNTTQLMISFHRLRNMANSGTPSPFRTARALRQAELRILHDPQFSHPFYWAGFIVVGNPN